MQKTINSTCFRKMIIASAKILDDNKAFVDSLNVFPVPDGDTGKNMLKTMEGGVKDLSKITNETVGEVMRVFANGALMGASGNSGVILSQILKGISLGLKDLKFATASDFATAFSMGVKTSYSAV